MNRRDFVGLLLGASVAPIVLPLPEVCSAFAADLEAREDVVQTTTLDTTLTQCVTDQEFLAIHYPPSKPDWALAS